MKRFIGFVIKEFYHIFRDKRTMLILFGMPLSQVLLFGFVLTNEIKDAKIALLDHSKDHVTQEITNKLLSSGYFQATEYLTNTDQIESTFKKGKVKEIVVFEPDFALKLEKEKRAHVQVIADASDPNMANLLVNYTQAIIADYQQHMNESTKMPFMVKTESRMYYNPEIRGVYMFIPGIMAMILMLVSAMMTSISIAKEKEMGTMEILLVSPLQPVQIILGKVIPYLMLSLINATVILFLGRFVFNVPINGSIVLLMLENILFIMMALSLGILISTVAKTQQVAMFISMFGLMLPTILLSGFIFPIENMPWPLQLLSNVMPPRWFIIIIKNIMLKGTGFQFVWKETLILTGMTIFFIGLATRKFKVRLE